MWPALPRTAPRRVRDFRVLAPDSSEKDTSKRDLRYPIKDKKPYEIQSKRHPFDLSDPEVLKNNYKLDPDQYKYDRSSTIGGIEYKLPSSSGISEQLKEDGKRTNGDYFRQRSQANNFTKGIGILPPININNKTIK